MISCRRVNMQHVKVVHERVLDRPWVSHRVAMSVCLYVRCVSPPSERGRGNCWAWRKHSCETNEWTRLLETRAAFPIKMARIFWFGSTSIKKIYVKFFNKIWCRYGLIQYWRQSQQHLVPSSGVKVVWRHVHKRGISMSLNLLRRCL